MFAAMSREEHLQNLLRLYEEENERLHRQINAREQLLLSAANWLDALASNPHLYTVADLQALAAELRKPTQGR